MSHKIPWPQRVYPLVRGVMRESRREGSKDCPEPPLSPLHLHQLHVCTGEVRCRWGEKEQFSEGPREGLVSFIYFLKKIKKE